MKLAKKISKKKQPKMTVAEKTALISESINISAKREAEERYYPQIRKTSVAIANLITVYTLAKDMKMSKAKCLEYLHRYVERATLIEENRKNENVGTSIADIVKYEIVAGKEFDKASLGWSDYEWTKTPFDEILNNMPEVKHRRDIFYSAMRVYALEISEDLMYQHEAIVISTLNDYMGYGLKRIKAFVEKRRALMYLTNEEFDIVLRWMQKRFDFQHIEDIYALRNFWQYCFKPRGEACEFSM